MRELFEQALLDDATQKEPYLIYADWLLDQGDPRGEFIHTQLGLEETASPDQQSDLRQREKQLWKDHGRRWLGRLAPYFLELDANIYIPYCHITFRRGFLYSISSPSLGGTLALAMKTDPQAQMLQHLQIEYAEIIDGQAVLQHQPIPAGVETTFDFLASGRGMPCLQSLTLGSYEFGHDFLCDWSLAHFLETSPQLRRLELFCRGRAQAEVASFQLPQLRHLRVMVDRHFPFRTLAHNQSLAGLESLELELPNDGDPVLARQRLGVDEILEAPHFSNVKRLTLPLGYHGDTTLETLTQARFFKQLEVLKLRDGQLTEPAVLNFVQKIRRGKLREIHLSPRVLNTIGWRGRYHLQRRFNVVLD